MKGTSRVIMGATLVMVVSLAVVLGLILVLLAELYCSLLLRRRHLRNTSTTTTPQTTTTTIATPSSYSPSQHAPHSPPPPPPPPHPFNNVYSQGVLQAPRTFLFPSNNIACMEEPNANANANHIGLVSVPSPLASFISRAPPKQVQEDPLQGTASHYPTSHVGQEQQQQHHLVYISNPIYENEEEGKASDIGATNTPFETPDTSPSRLEGSGGGGGGSSDEDHVVFGADKDIVVCVPYTPPLTPMKKLPTEACSVSRRDARSLVGASASDSRSNNGISSSSSVSPRTSPSW